jgi:hypothetical protein
MRKSSIASQVLRADSITNCSRSLNVIASCFFAVLLASYNFKSRSPVESNRGHPRNAALKTPGRRQRRNARLSSMAIALAAHERGLGSTRVLACDWPASPPANGSHIDTIATAVLTMLVADESALAYAVCSARTPSTTPGTARDGCAPRAVVSATG